MCPVTSDELPAVRWNREGLPSSGLKWHYPDSSCDELLKLVFPLLVSNLLGIGVHEPVIILVKSLHTDVRDLGHHRPQLHVARPLRQMEGQVYGTREEIKSDAISGCISA